MSRKRDASSQVEIAKQFLLPERQSKIDTLLKQDGQAYCICRSSDSSRFMIACDACEEWYHGDCIRISEREAKRIRQYICVRCHDEEPSLRTRWKKKREHYSRSEERRERKRQRERQDDYEEEEADAATMLAAASNIAAASVPKEPLAEDENLTARTLTTNTTGSDTRKAQRKCGQCVSCTRTEDCGRCDVCVRKTKNRQQQHGRGERCKMRICTTFGGGTPAGGRSARKSHRREDYAHQEPEIPFNAHLKVNYARQCYGPGCRNSARFGSKYCSDDCGLKLATNRILQVLPQRIQEWALSPCVAEEKNIKDLDSVRKQQMEVRQILQELDARHAELDAHLERTKLATVETNDQLADDGTGHQQHGDAGGEGGGGGGGGGSSSSNVVSSMYCITCGHEIHFKTAIKHMEKCFNKYESQTSFGSIFKTRIEGNNMFCDYYNTSTQTYCKRLRVLCPEHGAKQTADAISVNEVCGCPLVTNLFDLTGDFCRAPKKTCVRHYVWEKLRRAEIDMERVRQWLKMDELLERERQLRNSMANRSGVLALMLHSTYNHEVMEQMSKQQQQQHAVAANTPSHRPTKPSK